MRGDRSSRPDYHVELGRAFETEAAAPPKALMLSAVAIAGMISLLPAVILGVRQAQRC